MERELKEKIKNLQPNSKIRIQSNGVDVELKKRVRAIDIKPRINIILRLLLFILTFIIVFCSIYFILISIGDLISFNRYSYDGTATSFSGAGLVMEWYRDFWFLFFILTLFLSSIILKKVIFFFYKKRYSRQMEIILKLTKENENQYA